ncbi:hypothetical protein LTR37_000531 [Vermiconidia calcicola]|uniref:Uncharacterized protein n=1 Tax=Vermiconidia calcicola TaxID=1690605 RepID=A0ACC3NZ43_9PEZI|nr:hypothetical protein LTR37_000531 [Vermiconidia calcicola]
MSAPSRLRTPTLALAGLSMCLTLSIIGTAARSLHVYNTQQSTNPWLLPLWPNHFDVRELQLLIGTAVAIFLLNALLAVGLVVGSMPANAIVPASALLSTIVGVIAIAFPSVLNARAPTKDTLKTWTCRWSNIIATGEGPPMQFLSLCHKTVRKAHPTNPYPR